MPVALFLFFASVIVGTSSSSAMGGTLAAAGIIIVVRGYFMLTKREDVLAPLAERERRGIGGRVGLLRETPFGAFLLIVIGIGWSVIGALLLLGTL